MRLTLRRNTQSARRGIPSHGVVSQISCASFIAICAIGVVIGVAGAQESSPEAPSREEVHQGIEKSVRAQFEACNEESMDKLLAVVSKEMPDRGRYQLEVDSFWSGNDTHSIMDRCDVLDDSDAPGAEFKYPYATVRITQTVIELKAGNPRNSVFVRKCRTGDRKPLEIATQLGVLDRVATTSVEVLYKHEDGAWKLVNGLTEPVLAGSTGVGVPAFRHIHVSGSAFR